MDGNSTNAYQIVMKQIINGKQTFALNKYKQIAFN